jgi:hypothetical protein
VRQGTCSSARAPSDRPTKGSTTGQSARERAAARAEAAEQQQQQQQFLAAARAAFDERSLRRALLRGETYVVL